MSLGYAIAYRLGLTPWERAGEAAQDSFDALLDREEGERGRPFGRALDLGCGRGIHTHELARRGWDAVGVDTIPRALEAAQAADGSGASFALADVTRLDRADLGTFDFFLDIGCFHGLSPEQRRMSAQGITRLANPGATMLILAFEPSGLPFIPGGVAASEVEDTFDGWQLLSTELADTSGMPKPMKRTKPAWYRLRAPA